jgi:hypothetical protein
MQELKEQNILFRSFYYFILLLDETLRVVRTGDYRLGQIAGKLDRLKRKLEGRQPG